MAKELKGLEGYRAALEEPDKWEAKWDASSDWQGHDIWELWTAGACTRDHVQWRRIPEEPKNPMHYVGESKGGLVDGLVVGDWGESYISVALRLPSVWHGKRIRVLVDEVPNVNAMAIGHDVQVRPADEPAVEAPGTIITWQRAQERVDAGLAVEVTTTGEYWFGVNRAHHTCGNSYRYRIPLTEPVAQPEPAAEMNAERATEWLRRNGFAVMCVNDLGIWRASDVTSESLPDEPCFYCPLLPATESQVALLAEVERLKAHLNETALEKLRLHEELAQQLRDMTGSRDAAVAALEVERKARRADEALAATVRDELSAKLRDMNEARDKAEAALGVERNRVAVLIESTRAIIRCGHAALSETAGKGQG